MIWKNKSLLGSSSSSSLEREKREFRDDVGSFRWLGINPFINAEDLVDGWMGSKVSE